MARQSTATPDDVEALGQLPNLGPKSAAILVRAGITGLADLQRIGAVPAFLRARQQDARVSLNLLYALVGALEGRHWREIQRERRLELLTAIEDHERHHPVPTAVARLADLRSIGKAMLQDFALLKIDSVAQLARCDPDELYERIGRITGGRHDPCVWDTYAAAIHQAKTGEARPWWDFTRVRKSRPDADRFAPPRPGAKR